MTKRFEYLRAYKYFAALQFCSNLKMTVLTGLRCPDGNCLDALRVFEFGASNVEISRKKMKIAVEVFIDVVWQSGVFH